MTTREEYQESYCPQQGMFLRPTHLVMNKYDLKIRRENAAELFSGILPQYK
jgi:hypothetical protein